MSTCQQRLVKPLVLTLWLPQLKTTSCDNDKNPAKELVQCLPVALSYKVLTPNLPKSTSFYHPITHFPVVHKEHFVEKLMKFNSCIRLTFKHKQLHQWFHWYSQFNCTCCLLYVTCWFSHMNELDKKHEEHWHSIHVEDEILMLGLRKLDQMICLRSHLLWRSLGLMHSHSVHISVCL